MVKTSCWLRFVMLCHPPWAVCSYSKGQPAAVTARTKSTRGFYLPTLKSQYCLQVKNESRASYNFRNVYFMDEMLRANKPSGFFKDIPPYLHMLQHVYRWVCFAYCDIVELGVSISVTSIDIHFSTKQRRTPSRLELLLLSP